MTYKKIKTINSHAGLARYLAETEDEAVGYIPTPREIPSPYAYSASTPLLKHASGRIVFIKETRHKHYEVFEPRGHKVLSEEAATDRYLEGANK
jgi:hypothetical protein